MRCNEGDMRLIGLGLLWGMTTLAIAQEPGLDTGARPLLEQRNYQQLPGSGEVLDWLRQWAERAENARYLEIGRSAGDRPIGALLVSADSTFLDHAETGSQPDADGDVAPDESRLRIMIVGGQHGNETASPEAVQRLAYELLAGELGKFPQQADIILVPAANPDGRNLGQRENANNVNTNIDYILLTQPESRALSQAIKRWQPHTVLDVHESESFKKETLAQQGYITNFSIQYEVGFEPNIDRRLREFGTEQFMPSLLKSAENNGLRASRYIKEIVDINAPVTHGGITLRNFRNYSGFHHIFSVLVEGRIDPPEGDSPTPPNIRHRTNELSRSIATYLREAVAMHNEIIERTTAARDDWQGLVGHGQLALASEYTLDPAQPLIEISMQEIGSDEQVKVEFENHGKVVTLKTIDPPSAYLVTDHQDRIAELLARHSLDYQRINKSFRFRGVQREMDNIEIMPLSRGKGRYKVSLRLQDNDAEIRAEKGDLWIGLDQPYGRLIPLLLEPLSSNSIFQEQDYVSMIREGTFFIVPVSAENSQLGPVRTDTTPDSPETR